MLAWMRTHVVETVILAVGVLLRLTFHWHFEVEQGFDAPFHWGVATYMAQHWTPPARDFNCTAYNPSLYYFLAAIAQAFGATMRDVQWGSILFGLAHMGVFAYGVQRFVPSRLARNVGLVVVATLPANLHIDGLITPETLSKLLCTLALVLAASLLVQDDDRRRWRLAAWLGFVLGLAMMTKMSAIALVPAIGAGALVDAWAFTGDLRARARRFAPIAVALGMMAVIAAPVLIDNKRSCGYFLPTSFETHQKQFMEKWVDTPIWRRQPTTFFWRFEPTMDDDPYAPRASVPAHKAEFWSVLVASTFLDHWNFRFCHPPLKGEPMIRKNNRPLRPQAMVFSQWAYRGGLVVFAATWIAGIAVLVSALRRRQGARVALVLAPFFATLALLHFSTKYPINFFGVVKGLYMQFGAAPAYALFGVAVGWLWSRRFGKPFALALLFAYAPVVAYTLYCRVGTLIYDVFLYTPK